MTQHPPHACLALSIEWACFHLNPLGVSGRQRVAKADHQPILFVNKPAFSVLLRMTVNEWLVLLGHGAMLATLPSWCVIKACPLPVPLIDRRLISEREDDDSVWPLEVALPVDRQIVLVPRRARPGSSAASRVCRGTFLRGVSASRHVDSRPFHHPFGTLIATSLMRGVLNMASWSQWGTCL